MKFNQEKWERLQRQKELLHMEYMRLSDEWLDAKGQAGKTEGHFVSNYDSSRSALPIITQDKKLSYHDLKKRMSDIKNNWPTVCTEFGFNENSAAKTPLLNLYEQIVSAKWVYERRERLSEIRQAFGASWNQLQEFAGRYVKVDDSINVVAGD
ncbi:MAG: hypothetical protein M8364_02715 [Methylobacter sp.]|uniref:hypothetical protein n=1 Tax=Methylobacter sp. TaxID=2051955 RepID=UPI002587729F|nr:hypothetical protein [Methylobacter sp.]MCL7419803.1 hypothetical protein [Methylobacter sp.]